MGNFFISLFDHWKTSLAGSSLVIWNVVDTVALKHPVTGKEWLAAIAVALLGAYAKDGDK
jgi:hypothetical protein